MTPGHEMILASAGSGKTHALTNRFVQLLALGAAPERIVALTFTRKAAGEFFDEILTKLARAAADEAGAAKLARDLAQPTLRAADFCRLLRAVVDVMPRLALGTFDAFFARIVRAFPLELGLGGDFGLLEEYAARFERRRVLQHIFARTGREPDDAQREFIEAFKRATFGLEEKRLARLLDTFIDTNHDTFLAAPLAEVWGDPARIWPEGCAWLRPDGGERAASATLRAWALAAGGTDKQRDRWLVFLDACAAWTPGVNPPGEMTYILAKALAVWEELGRRDVELVIERRKQIVPPDAGAALRTLTRAVFAAEFTRKLESTRGVHAVLARYDGAYENLVRRAGRLTFADVTRLLGGVEVASAGFHVPGGSASEPETSDPESTAGGGVRSPSLSSERRLLLDWRLDGQFDHWLLDEFQDTSRAQWGVLRNLIDEVVQDASLQRTFFCVGDVKQAIYGWRGGDARLFEEIRRHYNRAGAAPAIRLTPMDQSWRSGPAILEMVNRVFGDAPALADLSTAAGARWSEEWRPHTSAFPDRTGHAAWLHADDEQQRFEITRQLLEEIRPLERGLSVAVLTQKNDTAARLADELRSKAHLPAIAEADLHIGTDNPVSAALLALVKVAAHPGDTLAWEHVQMTPLARVLQAANVTTPDEATEAILRELHSEGFAALLETWGRRLEAHFAPDDAFSRERTRQMIEAAREFDDTGSRDVAEFVQFMERHTIRDTESAAVVRVMTIHKSKGLTFDLTILPDLEGRRLATRRDGLAVHAEPGQDVAWVLDLPTKFFHERDDVLAAHVADEEADACYEKIALLYVAMTRARFATYALSTSAGGSESRNYPRLLTATLGDTAAPIRIGARDFVGGFAAGDAAWFESVARPAPAAPSGPVGQLRPTQRVPVERRAAHRPSEEKSGVVAGSSLFAAGDGPDAAEFGRAVHAALATVTWWNPAEGSAWTNDRLAEGLSREAVDVARACLDAAALAPVFCTANPQQVEVWRERRFEVVLDGAWVTGTFDRVLVPRTPSGATDHAVVYDFKTDRVGSTPENRAQIASRYRSQLELYRRAVARLTGISPERVRAAIVLTHAVDAGGQRTAPVELP